MTGRTTTGLKGGNNEEYEGRVGAVESRDATRIRGHVRSLARWNIRLADLETGNFSVSWLFMMGLLVFARLFTSQ